MNIQKLITALDATINSLKAIKISLVEEPGNLLDKVLNEKDKDGEITHYLGEVYPELKGKHVIDTIPTEQLYTELLANRLAWSYSTIHPEYKVDNQFKNLRDMISGSKISYVLNWIKKKGIEGLEDFFTLPILEQRKELQIAMDNYEDKIKEVFTKRFSQQ